MAGVALMTVGLIWLRHARSLPAGAVRRPNTAHQDLIAAAMARRRPRPA